MSSRAVRHRGLRRRGLERGRTSLGPDEALELPSGILKQFFGAEVAARLSSRARGGDDDNADQEG